MQFQPPQSLFLPKESVIPYSLHKKTYGISSNSYRESLNYTKQAMESSNISDYQNQNFDPSRINHRNTNHRIQQLQGMIKTLTTEDQYIQNPNSAANQVEPKREQYQYAQQQYQDQANILDSPARISSSYSQNQFQNQMQMKQFQQESSASSQYLQQCNTQNSNTNLQYFIRPSQFTKIQSNNIDLDRSAQNSARSFIVSNNDLVKNQTQFKTTQKSTTNLTNCKPNQNEQYSHSPSPSSSSSSHSSSSSTSKSQTNRKTKHSSHHHQRHHSNKKKNIDGILLENCCQLVKEVSLSRGLMELFSLTVGSGEHFRRLFLQRKYSDALVALFSLVLALLRMNPAGVGTVAPGTARTPTNLISKNSFFELPQQKDDYSSKIANNQTNSQHQKIENQRGYEAQNQGITPSRVFPISSCHVFGSDQQDFFAQRNSQNEYQKTHRNQLNQAHPDYQQTPTGTDTTNSQSFHDQPQHMKDLGYIMNKNYLAYKTNSGHQKSKQYEGEESQQESQQQYKQFLKHSQHEPQWELYNAEFSNNRHFNRQDGNCPSMTSQDFDDDSSNQRNYNQKINNATSKQPLNNQNRSKVKDILHPTHSNSNLVSSKKSEHLLQKKSALSSECHIHQDQQQQEELDQFQESCCSKHCTSQNTKTISNQKRLDGHLATPKYDKKSPRLLTNNNLSFKAIHLMPCMKGRGDKSPIHESTEKLAGDKTFKRENQSLERDNSTNSLRRDYQTKETDSRYNKFTNNSNFSENQQASKPEIEEEKKKQKNMDSQPRWKQ